MNTPLPSLTALALYGLVAAALQPDAALAQERASSQAAPARTLEDRDGRHDFDPMIGAWSTQVSLLQNPLTGSTAWVDYEGTSIVTEFVDGRANLVELDVAGPAGRIEGVSLRLYSPRSRQWGIHYASASSGTLTAPVFGGFHDGRGEFFGLDRLDGRVIYVKFVITNVKPDVWRYEQSFSADGGQTWEVNWIATDTRIRQQSEPASGQPG